MSPPAHKSVVVEVKHLHFQAKRSSGPGGQHVNKVSTAITISLDLDAYPHFTAWQKGVIRHRLAGRISREGILRVTSRKHRSQYANRKAAFERLQTLIAEALTPRRLRVPTKPRRSAIRTRLDDKTRRSRVKQRRRRVSSED
ncbi:MAG: aminoacyl-tRNA hydrolase [Chloroflexi bacterium]|nr:aminoacyl-tRNA hydrolase [Chloroflexota bacterium]